MSKIFQEVHEEHYMTMNMGLREITVLCDQTMIHRITKTLDTGTQIFSKAKLAAIVVSFPHEQVENVGFIAALIERLTVQHINIWELSSTYTELIFYVEEQDAQLTLETLYQSFISTS